MIAKGKSVFQTEKDSRIKIMNDRINLVERHFGEMCSAFAAFNRKLGRYRDKHDDLAKIFRAYFEEEILNNSLKNGLDSFSKAITLLSDYLDLEVQRIDFQITNELKQYEGICRNARETLKTAVSVRDKEVLRQKQLIDLKTKFSPNIPSSDSELLKMKIELNKTNKEIDEIIENFEKQKLKDIKNLLLNFIHIHLKQHTKSIQILSAACQDILNIDEKKDFQIFKKSIKIQEQKSNEFNKLHSQSVDNLTMSHHLTSNRGIKNHLISRSNKDLTTKNIESNDQTYSESNDESDEKDDDEIEDDDSEESSNFKENDSSEDESGNEEEEEDEENDDDNDDEDDETEKDNKSISSMHISKFKELCDDIDFTKNNASTPTLTDSHTTATNAANTTNNNAGINSRLVSVKSINGITKYHFVPGSNNNKKDSENQS